MRTWSTECSRPKRRSRSYKPPAVSMSAPTTWRPEATQPTWTAPSSRNPATETAARPDGLMSTASVSGSSGDESSSSSSSQRASEIGPCSSETPVGRSPQERRSTANARAESARRSSAIEESESRPDENAGFAARMLSSSFTTTKETSTGSWRL